MRAERMVLMLAVLCACDGAAPSIAEKTEKEIAGPIEGSDQYTLLADIRAAQSAEREERDFRYREVSRAWRGRPVRWEVAVLAPLCARADACMVLPFDQARLGERPGQGWLPRVELDAAEHARVRDACSDRPTCVITLEASVKELRLSTELPTAVTLRSARMTSARAPGAAESWARAPLHPSRRDRVL